MWINVNKELPKNDQWVFIATKDTPTCSEGSFYGVRRGIVWYDASGNAAPTDGITHWMPLPAPPKSDNAEEKQNDLTTGNKSEPSDITPLVRLDTLNLNRCKA